MIDTFKNKLYPNRGRHKTVLGVGLLLLGCLSGCGDKVTATELPQADAVLQLLHAEDESVIQIKLQQCQVRNLFEGESYTPAKNDIYRCQVTVERFDDEYKQSFLKNQVIDLRHDTSETGWQLY